MSEDEKFILAVVGIVALGYFAYMAYLTIAMLKSRADDVSTISAMSYRNNSVSYNQLSSPRLPGVDMRPEARIKSQQVIKKLGFR